MTTADALVKLRDLLAEQSCWTSAAFARNEKGRPVRWDSEDAVCWCLLGGIFQICGDNEDTFVSVREALVKAGGQSPTSLNDRNGMTHHKIIDLIDRATEETTNGCCSYSA